MIIHVYYLTFDDYEPLLALATPVNDYSYKTWYVDYKLEDAWHIVAAGHGWDSTTVNLFGGGCTSYTLLASANSLDELRTFYPELFI